MSIKEELQKRFSGEHCEPICATRQEIADAGFYLKPIDLQELSNVLDAGGDVRDSKVMIIPANPQKMGGVI